MVDGVTQKLITVTDGVSYPVISSTTYPITYTNANDANPTCRKVVFYSDNTSYISSTAFQILIVNNIHLLVLQKLIYIINHKSSFHI